MIRRLLIGLVGDLPLLSFHCLGTLSTVHLPNLPHLIYLTLIQTSQANNSNQRQQKGARFGPRAIRQASSRQTSFRGFNPRAGINPYASWATIIDCGDIPITPFDNAVALEQMTEAFLELGSRSPQTSKGKPKLITLGGDHSLALPALRALKKVYGREVRVVHFDG